MGDRRLEVEGKGVADKVSGMGIECALGAVCAALDERESGKTKVRSASCCVFWARHQHSPKLRTYLTQETPYGMLPERHGMRTLLLKVDGSRSSTCHLHAVSSLACKLLLPSTRDFHPVRLEGLSATEVSNRLPSNNPMYVVLARRAMNTMVCMGWVHARRETDCSTGVTCRLNQPGLDEPSLLAEPQKLLGNNDTALMVGMEWRCDGC